MIKLHISFMNCEVTVFETPNRSVVLVQEEILDDPDQDDLERYYWIGTKQQIAEIYNKDFLSPLEKIVEAFVSEYGFDNLLPQETEEEDEDDLDLLNHPWDSIN